MDDKRRPTNGNKVVYAPRYVATGVPHTGVLYDSDGTLGRVAPVSDDDPIMDVDELVLADDVAEAKAVAAELARYKARYGELEDAP